MKKQNFLKGAGFMAGLIFLLGILSAFIKPDIPMYNVTGIAQKLNDLSREEKDSMEVLFFGDSESYSAFNPVQMYKEQGFQSYVCGTSGQRLCDTYALLQKSLTMQKPKVIVLETNCIFRSSDTEKEVKSKVTQAYQKAFPILKNHNLWKSYLISMGGPSAEAAENGFKFRPAAKPYEGGSWMKKTKKAKAIAEQNVAYLKQLKTLAEENGALLVLVSAPSPKNWNMEKHNCVQKLADEMNVTFLDLNLLTDDLKIDWSTDTLDAGDHLNDKGAEKVSGYVGAYLNKTYSLSAGSEAQTGKNAE